MNVYERAIKAWGEEAQLRQTQEECAELIAAINQMLRGTRRREHVIEEIADVKIMIEQMEHMFDKDEIAAARKKKLIRLEDRLQPPTIVPKPCLDPDKMNGAGDQFPGSDY